jgi:tetratricopeptide (TPR) repeat protein
VEEALGIQRELGDAFGLQWSLHALAGLALNAGQLEEARALVEEALAANRAAEYQEGLSVSLTWLGAVALDQGAHAEARAAFTEGLTLQRQLRQRRPDTPTEWAARALEGFAGLAAAEGRATPALRLAGAASALRESARRPLTIPEHARLERWLAPARGALRQDEQAVAQGEGRAMPLEQAVAYALDEAPDATDAA